MCPKLSSRCVAFLPAVCFAEKKKLVVSHPCALFFFFLSILSTFLVSVFHLLLSLADTESVESFLYQFELGNMDSFLSI